MSRSIVREVGNKAKQNPHRTKTKPCKSMSRAWGSQWHHFGSSGPGWLQSSSNAQATCDHFLELTPFSASRFSCLVSDTSDISNILVISISTAAIPSPIHVQSPCYKGTLWEGIMKEVSLLHVFWPLPSVTSVQASLTLTSCAAAKLATNNAKFWCRVVM